MINLIVLVFSFCICISQSSFVFHKMEWRYLCQCNFSVLKSHITPMNKFLLFMLDKYKIISPSKKERNYFYYSKKMCKYLLFLSIPWFVTIYLKEWYLISSFIRWHLLFSFIIGLLPILTLIFMMIVYEIKAKVYSSK